MRSGAGLGVSRWLLTIRSRRTASPPLNSGVRIQGGIVRKLATVLVALSFHSGLSIAATTGEVQASSFISLYSSLCLKHVNNLDALREKLRPLPKLPPEKAEHFLAGRAGDVWPIPDKHGTFVLALPKGMNLCAVYGRRADAEAVQRQFSAIVATAPSPIVATRVANKLAQTSANGQTRTVVYEWSVPNAHRKLLFTLTTASSATAQIQAMGSAATVSE
ncbi:NMCC_0638 family (lipo)protein [Frateuria sp. GZRe14]|uniref:NMCC_0638 family (lipo)protein n=1 Tax=Frateuria sp. GZRe14 TaxID=3351534 RepID=UPI003F73EDA0